MGTVLIIVGAIIAGIGVVMTVSNHEKSDNNADIETTSKTVAEDAHQQPKENQSDLKTKGNNFEAYIADELKESGCRLIEWNQGTTTPNGNYAENEFKPDFLIGQKARGLDLAYWVECKYKSKLSKQGFMLEKPQFERYAETQHESRKKILIVLGVGGQSDKPDQIYVIPLDTIKEYKRVGLKYIDHYKTDNLTESIEDWFFEEVFQKKRKDRRAR